MVGTVTSLPSFIATPTARATDARAPSGEEQSRRDGAVSVDISFSDYRKDVNAARDDVAVAREALDLFIAVAKQARSLLLEARDVALRAAEPDTPDAARAAQDVPFRALVQELARLIDGATGEGARALAGESIAIDADPYAARDLEIEGLDLRVRPSGESAGAIKLTASSTVSTAADAAVSARAADESIALIDAGLRRIETGASRLGGHDALLSQLDSALAAQVRVDAGADAARLIALQVRQELTRSSSPIANVAPSAVLALFRE